MQLWELVLFLSHDLAELSELVAESALSRPL
jgi:hypothetical protein